MPIRLMMGETSETGLPRFSGVVPVQGSTGRRGRSQERTTFTTGVWEAWRLLHLGTDTQQWELARARTPHEG